MAVTRRAVLLPTEGAEVTLSPEVRGGKGANLAEMVALGLPVPPFFTIPTGICRAYMEHLVFPKRFDFHLKRGIAKLEKATGREFGSATNPLLVSVRSGAPVSMPGMMDTVLNVGMTLEALPALAATGGEEFAENVLVRVVDHFGQGEWPEWPLPSPSRQLIFSIMAVLDSWNSERAQEYRKHHNIPDWTGTAVNVQAMVFGNLDDNSGTGVVFSSNPSTGEDGLFGEWLARAQGEDIVSGSFTPEPICNLEARMPPVYAELKGIVEMLSAHVGGIADVEFTVEAGKLYVLQVRKAKVSPQAAATMAVRKQWDKKISREEAVASLTGQQVLQLKTNSFAPEVVEEAMKTSLVAEGQSASPGAAVGLAVYSAQEALVVAGRGYDVVLVRPDTSPDDLPGMLVSKAIVTGTGGMTCHAAMVANAQSIPAVVGVGEIPTASFLSVDATNGRVFHGKLSLEGGQRTKEVNIFLKWVAQQKPTPRLDFDLLDQRFCMNQVLNDFYLAQQMAKASAGSSLEREVDELWRKIRDDTAVLMGTYLALAVGRELRHAYGDYLHQVNQLSSPAHKLILQLVCINDEVVAMNHTAAELPKMELGEQTHFAQLAMEIFDLDNWQGRGGVGGKCWAAIARALLAYLDGSWEFDTFVDHAFDLRHHGGVLFNKHPMVYELTIERTVLIRQLDVKKSVSDVRKLFEALKGIDYRETGLIFRPRFTPQRFGEAALKMWNKGKQLRLW